MTAGLGVLASVPAVLAVTLTPASAGVGIQPGPVCLASAAHPGRSYALPPVVVSDSGSGSEDVSLRVEKQSPGGLPGRPVPASWVRFTYPKLLWVVGQSSVHLGSGDVTAVPAQLSVPPSAAPGRYAAWVVAGPAGNGTPGRVSFGAAAITYLEFTVARPGAAPRHAACVSPGVKQARKAGHARGPRAQRAAAAPAPRAQKVTGSEVLAACGISLLGGGLALWRKRRVS